MYTNIAVKWLNLCAAAIAVAVDREAFMAQIIHYFYTSNVGKCRKTNQDNFYCNGVTMPSENDGTNGVIAGSVNPSRDPVFAIYDGMGGEEAGEMAAWLATEEMKSFSFKKGMEQGFFDFCYGANRRICEYTVNHGISSMGTTAAMMRFTKSDSGLCNIGDSKIFLHSEGTLTQLSYDHIGIPVFGRKPPLTQNLGIPEDEILIEPYVAVGKYNVGDVYLLCSDGLTDMVTVSRIEEILSTLQGRAAAELLLQEALQNGGKDNVTFILLYVNKKPGIFGKRKEVRKWQ